MRTLLIESQPSCGRAVEERLREAGSDAGDRRVVDVVLVHPEEERT
jgi:hypothetical protein